jgi:hypothetical protein
MVGKKKSYEEGSIMDFAVKGFSNIKALAESSTISDKLLGFNTLMFVLVLSFPIAKFFGAKQFDLSFLVIYLLSLAISFGISLIYSPILSLVAQFAKDKIEALRFGLMILFIDLPISIASMLFEVSILIKLSFIVIGIQIIIVLFSSFLNLSATKIEDKTVTPRDIWLVIDRTSAIMGIISFIASLILFIIR